MCVRERQANVTALMIIAIALLHEDLCWVGCAVCGSEPCVHFFWGMGRPALATWEHSLMYSSTDLGGCLSGGGGAGGEIACTHVCPCVCMRVWVVWGDVCVCVFN